MTKTEDVKTLGFDATAVDGRNTPPTDGVPTRLWGFAETIEQPVRSLLFGQMVQRAIPIVEHYHSDLFHDAMNVAEIDGPTEFWWGAREWGTQLAANEAHAAHVHRVSPYTWWHVKLECVRGTWYVTFDKRLPNG